MHLVSEPNDSDNSEVGESKVKKDPAGGVGAESENDETGGGGRELHGIVTVTEATSESIPIDHLLQFKLEFKFSV